MTLRVFVALWVLVFLSTGCGRPLTPAEKAFSQSIHGDQINTKRVRVVDGALVGNVTSTRPARPRVACRERIWPPPKSDTVTTGTAAIVLFNTVFVNRYFYSQDYLDGYPAKIPLAQAMLLAHELTHVWQWQNRDLTGYHPLRAASEHKPGADPYLFDLKVPQGFLEFTDEQQAAIVEEYVCCRTLDPKGARTARLRGLLDEVLPLQNDANIAAQSDPILPWSGARTRGICS